MVVDELKKITRNDLYLKIITIDITKLVQISSYDFQTISKTFKTISLWHLYQRLRSQQALKNVVIGTMKFMQIFSSDLQTVTLDTAFKAISAVSSAYLDPTYIFVISSLIKQKNT